MSAPKRSKAARTARLQDSISALAALYEFGHLLVSTDPDALLMLAVDEIRAARAGGQGAKGAAK